MTFLLTEVGESNLQERSRRGMREEFKALSMNGEYYYSARRKEGGMLAGNE